MKLYTRRGDAGNTDLFNGSRVAKNHILVDAYGTVDECNAAIGLATSHLSAEIKVAKDDALLHVDDLNSLILQLETIQRNLFDIGAHLATPQTSSSEHKVKRTHFPSETVSQLEQWIDQMDAKLDPLTTFILPGGHPSAASLHLARTIARRAERRVTPLFLAEQASFEECLEKIETNGSSKAERKDEEDATADRDIDPAVYKYLNRLSDFLFVASRMANFLLGESDVKWRS